MCFFCGPVINSPLLRYVTCDVPCFHLRRAVPSPATFRAFTCDGKRPLSACSVAGQGAKCRRSAFFCSPATGNGHPVPCSVAGRLPTVAGRLPTVAGQGAKCRRSAGKVSQVCVFPFTCDGKQPHNALQCRRSAIFCGPATFRAFTCDTFCDVFARVGEGCGVPGRLRSAALHSGPSHCLLRPRWRGNLYPAGPSPYPCAGVHKLPGTPHPSLPRNVLAISLLYAGHFSVLVSKSHRVSLVPLRVDRPTVAGRPVKCRRSVFFRSPATFCVFTCDGKRPPSALQCRRSAEFCGPATGNGHLAPCSVAGHPANCRRSGGKVSQVGCQPSQVTPQTVACLCFFVHLRREMVTQRPAASQVRGQSVAGLCFFVHLRRETSTQRLAVSQVGRPTVAGLAAKCRRSAFFRSPATENGHPVPYSVAGRLPTVAGLAAKCRRSAFFRSPATGNVHSAPAASQVRGQSVAGLRFSVHLRREMATQCLQRRRSAEFCGPATFRAFTCDGKRPLSACSVAGLGAKCRRSAFFRSPATGNGHPAPCSVAGQGAKCRRSAFFPSPAT